MSNKYMTDVQQDIIGEIANISMGNSATNLSMMVNQLVDITTPKIEIINRSAALDDYERTCIFVDIHYVKGLAGNNVLILKDTDVLTLTDLMMGGSGQNVSGEITELHLSAVSEAMNQMMGAAATSLSTMLKRDVDISPPTTHTIDVESVKAFEKMFISPNDDFVKITFRLTVGDIMDSIMVQLYPIAFAMDMIHVFEQ